MTWPRRQLSINQVAHIAVLLILNNLLLPDHVADVDGLFVVVVHFVLRLGRSTVLITQVLAFLQYLRQILPRRLGQHCDELVLPL